MATTAFEATLPELTDSSKSSRASVDGEFKFFRSKGSTIVCQWDHAKKEWSRFADVPPQTLTKDKAKQIIVSLKARSQSGRNALEAVSSEDIRAAILGLLSFVGKFGSADPKTFAFDKTHAAQLAEMDRHTRVLYVASQTHAPTMFATLFADPDPRVLSGTADAIRVLTTSIENMVNVDESTYSSEILLKCGKVRQQLLQAVQLTGASKEATMRVVALAKGYGGGAGGEDGSGGGSGDDGSGGQGEGQVTQDSPGGAMAEARVGVGVGVGVASRRGDICAAVVGVLHAVSAKFDFVSVQVAAGLLRNWALAPDAAFRRALINEYRAVSAVVKLFGHKDANVAGTAIATLRHLCGDPQADAVQNLTESDVEAIEAFSRTEPEKVHPVVRVEFGRFLSVFLCQVIALGSKQDESDATAHRMADITARMSTMECMASVLFLLSGPHAQLHTEAVGLMKALGWIGADGTPAEAKLDALEIKVDGNRVIVAERLRSLGLLQPSAP